MVPKGWVNAKISDVLERVSIPVTPEQGVSYREIGIRSHGKGTFHKEAVTSVELGNKRVFQVVEDALVLNIVFAWEQAVAKTTTSEAGFIASHRFLSFCRRKISQILITSYIYSKRQKVNTFLVSLLREGLDETKLSDKKSSKN